MTALGRTGAWTGARLLGVQSDMMCTANAITNGYFPFGATMISAEVAEVFEAASNVDGLIEHGYTCSGHPVGAAAVPVATSETMWLNVAHNARQVGDHLMRGLEVLKTTSPRVGDIGGRGLMLAIDLVFNREIGELETTPEMRRVDHPFFEQGVPARIHANNVILSPAVLLERNQADSIPWTVVTALGVPLPAVLAD